MRELSTAEAIARVTAEDCYQFTASVVFEVTGRDFRDRFSYLNERQAHRIIRKAGGLLVLATGVLGEPCDPAECDDGDPVLVNREMLGIRFQSSVVVKSRNFVHPLPLSFATHGWKL